METVAQSARPTDVDHFPRKALVIPALIPVIVLAIIVIVALAGADLNPHGFTGILIGVMMAWAGVATLVQLAFLPRAILMLLRGPTARTTENVLTTGFAVVFAFTVVLHSLVALLA